MKTLLVTLFVLVSSNVFAAKSAVYCKENGKVKHILSGEWDTCNYQLIVADVCFTGQRSEVIELLNSEDVLVKFVGSDGEYIDNAKYNGKDAITYKVHDDANGWVTSYTINRCSPDFFKN